VTAEDRNGTASRPLTSLFGLALLLGLGEALSAFFLGRVRFESGPVWLAELVQTAALGTLAGSVLVLALGAALKALGLVGGRSPAGGWRAVVGRLGALPTVAIAWLAIRLEVGGGSWVVRAIVGAVLAIALVAFLLRGLPPALQRARSLWPLAAGVLGVAASWWSIGGLVRKRFEAGEVWPTLGYAAEPLVLLGLAWGLTVGRRAPLRAAALAIAVALSVGGAFLLRPQVPEPAPREKPNIVFIVVDTLRADRVWGEHESMPRVKQLAGTGLYYTHAYTPIPKTQQSVSSFHTGRYPWHSGVRTLKQVLGAEQDTIAEKLGRAGYRTVAFVQNPWIDYGMGHQQGFHEYHDYYKVESFSYLLHDMLSIGLADHTVGRKRAAFKFQVDGARLTDEIVAWLESPPDGPFFMWVQYFDPHWPYLPPRSTPGVDPADFETAAPVNGMRGHSQRGINIFHGRKSGVTDEQTAAAARLYSGETRHADQQIARVLERVGERDDTVVLITADHGESLGEHDYHFHHGAFTYDVCLRVPLALSWPGHLPAGRVVDEPVMTVDILPTLAALAGVEAGQVDGAVLPGTGDATSGDPGRVVPFEGDVKLFEANDRIHFPGLKGKWRGVIAERHKLIAVPHPEGTRYQFYDLEQDPGELRDLHEAQRDVAAGFAEELEALGLGPGGEIDGSGESSGYNLDPEEIERLRALGYLQ